MDEIARDRKILIDLGGPTKVAELLGIEKSGGQQRVQNWLVRGIPSAVKVARPDLFMPELTKSIELSAQPAIEAIAKEGAV